jgi:TRAP transporter 4TM/12TM fusion protein
VNYSLLATGRRRSFDGPAKTAFTLLCALFALWVIYINLFVIADPLVQGILFVSISYSLLFLGIGGSPTAGDKPTLIDWTLSALSFAAGVYFFLHSQEIRDRISLLDEFTTAQLFFGSSLLALTLEATRRTTGLGLTSVVVLFLLYNQFGSILPPPFGHGVSSYAYLLDVLVFTMDGLFGVPIEVVASYVFLFVLFGTLLSKAGGGDFFFNLAASLTGKSPGGPAKVAIISSGLYGTMSGSPTSDVVATGSITIPIMRKLGYQRRFAGAVEVAASTGGSAMPPIMGSAAFIMAEYTDTPYRDIVLAAIIPALLYYFGVFMQVHFRSVRYGLQPYAEAVPPISHTLRSGWPYLIPIAVIVGILLAGYSPTFTAGAGIFAVVVGSSLTKRTRMSLWNLVEGLAETTARVLPVAGACAAAGLVIGGISMTGLGMKAASLILTVAANVDWLTLLIAAVVTIILGLGMPTPSAYILAAVLVGPALSKVGFPLLEGHMFLIYFAILSALTPPVAVAALAAAAIADEDPIRIALDAMRLAAVGFILPFAFLWNPAILGQGDGLSIAMACAGGLMAVLAIATAFEWPNTVGGKAWLWPMRGLLLASGGAALSPSIAVALTGLLICGFGLISVYVTSRGIARS